VERGEPGFDAATETLSILLATHALACDVAQARESRGRPVLRCDLQDGPMAGRDLACWCPLDEPCHADVLLEIANR